MNEKCDIQHTNIHHNDTQHNDIQQDAIQGLSTWWIFNERNMWPLIFVLAFPLIRLIVFLARWHSLTTRDPKSI